MAAIEFVNIDKVYKGGEVKAVDNLNLYIADGEFMVFVGPSGCGKTTSLRMIAGLEDITSGEIRIGDRVVNDVPPKDRDIAMVFQNYALYPHMTVRNNLSFGLRLRKMAKPEQDRRVGSAAGMLGLDDFLARRPGALSGGQRQRVAMGRAIVREPQAFLMDEPLSNLDAKLRVSMRASLNQLHERLGTTTVFVTHDQVEAMTLGDRVAVMRDGKLQQADSPQNLYDNPANLFVAGFIGSPSMNFVLARLDRDNGPVASFAGMRLPIPESVISDRPGLENYFGKDVVLGIRPPDFEDAALPNVDPNWTRIPVKIDVIEQLGSEINVLFLLDAPPLQNRDMKDLAKDASDDGETGIPLTEKTIWTARVNARSKVRPGEPLELAIDTSRAQFFDPESGLALGRSETALLS